MDIGCFAQISAGAFPPPLLPRRPPVTFRPKYITFDCYGTLTYFPMHQMAYDIYEGQLPPERMRLFVKDFADYRFDEVMGDWKPYHEILQSALERTCQRHGLTYRDED